MEKIILAINIGSSSKKYSLYKGEGLLCSAYFERDKDSFDVTYNKEEAQQISKEIFVDSLSTFRDVLKSRGYITDEKSFDAMGIRLVAPGAYFTEDRIIDGSFLQELSVVAEKDPAHIGPTQLEIAKAKELFGDMKIVAVSDGSFHRTMPQKAKVYALPRELAEKEGLYRFGYHGISLASIVANLSSRPLGLEPRTIICHLGSGASITAVLNGKSVDTSMGYSPLEGIVMSSRIGNIDAGAILHLAEKKGVAELQTLLYKECGLLALSGLSDDLRVLLDSEKEHEGARFAVESLAYSIQKYIGMYAAVLGGVDAIVFSGTIGERSFILRNKICCDLGWLNVHVDEEKNNSAKTGDKISKEGSCNIYVMHSDEDLEIMRKASSFV